MRLMPQRLKPLPKSANNIGADIHISTDYVFDGKLDRSYMPSDTNPLNVYGASKLAGEQAIQTVGGNYSIVRTSWLYSQYGNNFYAKLQAQLDAGKTLRVTADQGLSYTSRRFGCLFAN